MSINLSCAECNAIRPFSGGPPHWKCDGCGWELGTSSQTTGRSGSVPTLGQPHTVNLSCSKCRVVRSFSGDPLQCDVCGWMVTTAGQFSATGQLVRCGKCKKPRRDLLDEFCQYCGAKKWEVGPMPTASSKEAQGCFGDVFAGLGAAVSLLVALGALWAFIALVKWFWNHS
jgi:hypothetical protein